MPMRVLVLHGSKGNAEGNWFPWLKARCRERGVPCLIPQFPTPFDQNLENWRREFRASAGPLEPDDILIGHSLGAPFALRLLEESPVAIRRAVLVCGFIRPLGIPQFARLNLTFVRPPFNWHTVRKSAKEFVCLAGDNDPYVPPSFSNELAGALGTEEVQVKGGGHLNAEFGFTELPLILDYLT
jgi:predicted alpha/beta hydrolase family esterase